MNARDPLTDPRPGDRFRSTFARGCTITVATRRLRAGGKGYSYDYVAVRIEADDGHRVEARGRTYRADTLRQAFPALTVFPPVRWVCGCGHEFQEDLGRYGCPNCNGDQGARAVLR